MVTLMKFIWEFFFFLNSTYRMLTDIYYAPPRSMDIRNYCISNFTTR